GGILKSARAVKCAMDLFSARTRSSLITVRCGQDVEGLLIAKAQHANCISCVATFLIMADFCQCLRRRQSLLRTLCCAQTEEAHGHAKHQWDAARRAGGK